jgi:hypothetical protein
LNDPTLPARPRRPRLVAYGHLLGSRLFVRPTAARNGRGCADARDRSAHAEILSEAGNWTLAFELADRADAGAYQGASQTGVALGRMLAPVVVTASAIEHGRAGWAVLSTVVLVAGLSTLGLVRWPGQRAAVHT